MEENIRSFSSQIKNNLSGFDKIKLENKNISSVLIVGQGGSGIAGVITSDLLKHELEIPVSINNGYDLPKWVNQSTLIIISSYSGNTEETLNILNKCLTLAFQPICLTSGGKVLEICENKKLDCFILPQGFHPREALAFSISLLFLVFYKYQVISKNIIQKLINASNLILNQQEKIIKKSKKLSNNIFKKIPIVYSTNFFYGAILRFKQQLNENSKVPCWINIIPEMNHNEIVGWENIYKNINKHFSVIFIKSSLDKEKNKLRTDISIDILKTKGINSNILTVEEGDLFFQYILLINLFDFTSFYLANKNNIDPYKIESISFLKSKLTDSNG